MSILDELKAMEQGLRGIKAPKHEGNGHNFGKSKVNRKARGEREEAPEEIYRENMKSEGQG